MPTTSNFGWTTPADTDLVKDGAAAIRTLGNGIDTSLIDLKGGTTGQVLSKNSNTDLDYTWVTPNVGDITEVQAGTGISVASGTGPIPVVTNTVATAFDAKGDLIVGTGADTFARLAVGATNGHTLQIDSSTATGLKWAAAGGGTFAGVSLKKSGNQAVPNTTNTYITFDQESFDTDAYHDNSTNNSRITIPSGKGGKYLFTYVFSFSGFNGNMNLGFHKNGSFYTLVDVFNTVNTTNYWMSGAFVIDLVATDYIQMYWYQNSGGNVDVRGGDDTRLQAVYLGA